jgi:hypothetical protein
VYCQIDYIFYIFPVSVLSDPSLTTSVYPVCWHTAITRSWQYTGYSASVLSEVKIYLQPVSYQFHVSVLSDRHLCNQSIVSVSSVCCQYVVSVLSETTFHKGLIGSYGDQLPFQPIRCLRFESGLQLYFYDLGPRMFQLIWINTVILLIILWHIHWVKGFNPFLDIYAFLRMCNRYSWHIHAIWSGSALVAFWSETT